MNISVKQYNSAENDTMAGRICLETVEEFYERPPENSLAVVTILEI